MFDLVQFSKLGFYGFSPVLLITSSNENTTYLNMSRIKSYYLRKRSQKSFENPKLARIIHVYTSIYKS